MTIRQQIEQMYTYMCRQEALYGEWAKRRGISYHTMMTLYALDQEQPCTQKQIAEEWMVPKQTVNTIVKNLERQGYLVFTAGRDQKEKLISFTEAGRAYARQYLGELYEREERAMEAIHEPLRQALLEGMRIFTEAFAWEVHHE